MPDLKTRITLQVSNKNECTESPWWVLIDPSQIKSLLEGVAEHGEVPDIDHITNTIAFSIEGPFFSREEGQQYLKARHYAYSKNAVIWCASGYRANQYKQALRKAVSDSVSDVQIEHIEQCKIYNCQGLCKEQKSDD